VSRAIVPPSSDRWRIVKPVSSAAALAILVVASATDVQGVTVGTP
jgi:hypothetical protein